MNETLQHLAADYPVSARLRYLLKQGPRTTRELADAIAKQRRKPAAGRVTLIPLDARDWRAHVPTDAPELAKNLVARLRAGA